MLTKDNLQILDILKTREYVTASVLAEKAECSSKTIRSRIKEMNDQFRQIFGTSVFIESKPRYGFRLICEPHVQIEELCQVVSKGNVQHSPSTPGERANFLLFLLLERNDYITISELADILFVSVSVLKTALKNTEHILKQYGIRIVRRPGYGILAVGEEAHIRDCLVDLIMEQKSPSDISENPPKQELERLADIVFSLMKQGGVSLPETAFYNFIKYIYISMRRIKKGKRVRFQSENQVHIDASNMEFINCLEHEIQKYYDIEFAGEEKEYLAIHLAGKRIIGNNGDGNLVVHEDIHNLVAQMIEITYEEFNLNLRGNFDLIMILTQHMVPLDIRLRYNIPLVNLLLEDIQKNYPFAYTIAERTSLILQEYYGKAVPEDEIGHLAIIYALALEKEQLATPTSNILIVCSSGKGSSRLLSYKYRQEFGDYIDQIKVCNLFELKQINFEEIDYVFTTVPIEEPVPVPVYEVSLFLNGEDILNVRQVLEKGNHGFLKSYFREDLCFTGIQGQTKEQVLRELCELGRNVLELPDGFERSVLYREEMSSTDYGNYVAIPHPYKAMTEETAVIVGILEEPIHWGRNLVQVVFLISIGSRADRNIQRFYQETMRILMDETFIQTMIHNQDLAIFLN